MTLKEECSGQRKMSSTKHTTIVDKKGHISSDCPKPDKRKNDKKSKHRYDSSDDDEDEKKNKSKKLGKKKCKTPAIMNMSPMVITQGEKF